MWQHRITRGLKHLLVILVLLLFSMGMDAIAGPVPLPLEGPESAAARTGRRSVGGAGVTLAQEQWINHMCKAQCEAYCRENMVGCERYCQGNESRSWIFTCYENDQEFRGQQNTQIQRFSECPGSCSVLQHLQRDPDIEGYVPPKPVPVLVRDLAQQSVTVSWTQPRTAHAVMYVVQESEESDPDHYENWSSAHLVLGDHYERANMTEACSKRKYRVAAVSKYGSYWFGDEVIMPDMVPSSPVRFNYTNVWYNNETNEFHYTLEWHSPTAWTVHNLQYHLRHRWICRPTIQPNELYEGNIILSNYGSKMEVRIPEYAVGCKVAYGVNATSRCRNDLTSSTSWIILDLSCTKVSSIYSGKYCTPPPFNPPGHIEIENMHVVPGMDGARLHVTWSPPQDLGSSGRVGFYTVFYGTYLTVLGGFTNQQNFTVDAETLQVDIPFPTEHTEGSFGVMVMAGAPGQEITHPMGLIQRVTDNPDIFPGEVLVDDGEVIVYREPRTHRVRVYYYPLSPPPPPPSLTTQSNVTRVAMQWGLVDRRHRHTTGDAWRIDDVTITGDSADVRQSSIGDATSDAVEESKAVMVQARGQGESESQGEEKGVSGGMGYVGHKADHVKLRVQNTSVFVQGKSQRAKLRD